jgi:DNA topoisomerase I
MARTKHLVIVESPAKARTIGKYLGPEYSVRASVGHIRDLPERELGVDVDAGFEPKYVTIRGKGKVILELRRHAEGVADIILATDPDREGEAIAYHVAEQLGYDAGSKDNSRFRRVLFHEITKDAVHRALQQPLALEMRKVEAQQARRILDRLVGYQVSPLLWKPIRPGLSAGRVQTVALRLITERETEIRAFVAEEYWSVTALLEKDGTRFEAKLHQIDGKAFRLRDEAAASGVLSDIANLPFVITDLKRRQRVKNAPPPFTTSTLQQEAAKRLGFTAQRTMRTAQQLYEGMDVGSEGSVGLITYMRTDSTRVAGSAAAEALDLVRASYGDRYVPESPRSWGGKKQKGAQEAHEAIRPTSALRRPDDIRRHLDRDQFRLYELIWLRFVAGQMAPALYDTTTADFELRPPQAERTYLFRATGSIMVFDGFTRLYQEAREDGDHRTLDDLDPLPALAERDVCDVHEIVPAQHFTQPPPRFTEASLVKELERLGIGRPSTYAQIITTLTERKYVELTQKRFEPTPLGETVAAVLVNLFPDIFSVDFTSLMEAELDRVEEGELDWRVVLQEFYEPFQRRLAEGAERGREVVRDALAVEAGPCPECSRDLAVRWNRFGRFLGCTGYPECRYTHSIDEQEKAEPKPTGELCPKCGAAMFEREGRFGPFIACSNYPACKHTQPRTIPGLTCPGCGLGAIGEKRTRRGKPFWSCTRYPECEWSIWDEPVPRRCPNCEGPFMVRKSTKARGEFLRCPTCAHEYSIGADGELEPAGVGVPTPAGRRARKDADDAGGSGGAARGRRGAGAATRRTGAKKSPAKKTAVQQGSPAEPASPPKKAPAKKSTARKSTATKSTARKSTATKTTATKSTATKSTTSAAKTTPLDKPPAKRDGGE